MSVRHLMCESLLVTELGEVDTIVRLQPRRQFEARIGRIVTPRTDELLRSIACLAADIHPTAWRVARPW